MQALDAAMIMSPLLAGLPPEELASLERRGSLRKFAPGDSLFVQGWLANEMFVIVRGRVKVWRASEDGTSLTLTILGRTAPLGTLGAAHDTLNHATATALIPTEAFVWSIATLRELMDQSPMLTANVLRTVTNYAEQLVERLEEVASVPVEQRLARTLLRMAKRLHGEMAGDGCELPLSRQDLADLISATLPTTSRTMSRWRADGLIGGTRGRVRILDIGELGRIAERSAA